MKYFELLGCRYNQLRLSFVLKCTGLNMGDEEHHDASANELTINIQVCIISESEVEGWRLLRALSYFLSNYVSI